jgi:S-adenosylmethionine synthetase
MERNIVVTDACEMWIEARAVEIVERKGIGHPDSLCDGIAERIAVDYTRWCREHLGTLLHHNFDKVQLVAGEAEVDFGGGCLLKPIRIQIAGRGAAQTGDGRAVPLDIIAIQAAKSYLRETMRNLDPERHCVVNCYAGHGAGELIQTVERVKANDTSFGVAHWPFSVLERTVYAVSQHLNHALPDQFPIGEDVKVMGARLGERITLTCAAPLLATDIADLSRYRAVAATGR